MSQKIKLFLKNCTYGWNGGFMWEMKAMSVWKWLAFMVFFSALNGLEMWLAIKLDLPYRMDIVGVCYAAYFLGPVATMLISFISYFALWMMGFIHVLYFVPAAVLGIGAAYAIRYLEHNSLSLALIIASGAGFVATILCVPISMYLYDGYTGNYWLNVLVDYGRDLGFSKLISCFHGELFGNMMGKQMMVAYCWTTGQLAYGFVAHRKEKKKFFDYGLGTFIIIVVFFATVVIVANLENASKSHLSSETESYRIILEDDAGNRVSVTEKEIHAITGNILEGPVDKLRFQLTNKYYKLVIQERTMQFISEVYETDTYRYVVLLAISVMILVVILSIIWNITFQRREKRDAEARIRAYVDTNIFNDLKNNTDLENMMALSRRKEIAVFFIDLRGFTSFTEKHETGQVVKVLNRYLEIVTECIKNNDGTLDKYIGDAVMALFNAPNEVGDFAYKAVKTALDIKEHWLNLNRQFAYLNDSLAYGVGIHVGEAIVGNIGCASHMDYTAVGDAVNIASRLESGADPGEILISEEVYKMIEDRVEAESIGAMSLKGKKQEVETYIVRGLKTQK